jgi:hypothetical protein
MKTVIDMATLVKQNTNDLTPDQWAALQNFIEKIRTGEVVPFKEQIERGRKNLKKAGLIK